MTCRGEKAQIWQFLPPIPTTMAQTSELCVDREDSENEKSSDLTADVRQVRETN